MPGFRTHKLQPFTLVVNQTATLDLSLQIGEINQEVQVEAVGAEVQSSTAELGAAVTRQQVTDLPLNGRNFTQLLALTPGVAPVSVSQNSGGFGATVTMMTKENPTAGNRSCFLRAFGPIFSGGMSINAETSI